MNAIAHRRLKIPSKMRPMLEIPKRFKVLYGGRGSGKSQGVGSAMLMKAETECAKTLCLRELQNSIDDSVHSLLRTLITDMRLDDQFSVTDKKIRFRGGDAFTYRGMARNPDAVKSLHGHKYAWGEEAQAFSEDSLRMLTPTIRESDSELWFTMNPGSQADPMSQRFLEPFMYDLKRDGYYEDDQHLIIAMNYRDNPWFPAELEAERQWDYANLPRAVYDHIWEGAYLDEIDGSIIPAEWFDAAIDAHIKLKWKVRGAKFVSHDPSDNGADAKGLAYRHGSVFKDVTEYTIGDVNAGCDWATDYATAVGADTFIWDCDGLGVSLRRQIGEALGPKRIDYQEFKGSMAVDYPDRPYDSKARGGRPKKNKDTFKNKRSQYGWGLRDKFYNTYRAVVLGEYVDPDDCLSLSSDIKYLDKLRSEVCRIPLTPNDNGLIQLMSKKDMKLKHKIDSPNMFDSMMMSYASKTPATERRSVSIPRIKQRRMSR